MKISDYLALRFVNDSYSDRYDETNREMCSSPEVQRVADDQQSISTAGRCGDGMHDFPVSIPAIQSWKQGVTAPGKLAAKALEAFLEQHPKITDAPKFGRWSSPNKDVPEIRNLRKSGMTLLSIGERFGLSESAVSRICAGNRRATAVQKAPIRET